MAVNTTAGSKLYVADVHAPATDTAAEYAALTWVEVKEIESLGEFGDESNAVNFLAVSDARTRKLKGSRDAGTMAVTCGRDPTDAGQLALKAAEKTKFNYDFKVVAADAISGAYTNSIFYFAALVMSGRNNLGGADEITKTMFNLGINTEIIEVPSAPV